MPRACEILSLFMNCREDVVSETQLSLASFRENRVVSDAGVGGVLCLGRRKSCRRLAILLHRFLLAHHQYRAVGVANHGIANAPHESAPDPAPSSTPDHY